MDMELLLSGVNAEHVSSLHLVTKITNDMQILEASKLQLKNIVEQLHARHHAVDENKFIHVNVGGDIVMISSASIQQHIDNSYLFAIISGRYDGLLSKDKNGLVFLDLDVRWIEPWFNLLRDMAMWNGENTSIPQISAVHPLSTGGFDLLGKHFNVKLSEMKPKPEALWLSAQSDILRDLPASDEVIRSMLPCTETCTLTAKLLFRSSRDGLAAASFHKRCDGHKNTLCVIRSADNSIYGGFTGDAAWKVCERLNNYDYVPAPNAFLFLLQKCSVFKPVKCKAKSCCSLRYSSITSPRSLFAFGTDSAYDSSDFVLCEDSIFYWYDLGKAFDCEDKSDFVNGKISELEVFEIIFDGVMNVQSTQLPKSTQSVNINGGDMSVYDDMPVEYAQIMKQRLDMNIQIQESISVLRKEARLLCDQAVSLLNELKFVAKFVGITLPAVVHKDEEDSVSDMSELEKTLNEIQNIINLLFVGRAKISGDVVAKDASSIVYINAGGRKIATTKAVLLQAPSGSILANMASDVWGHDLDSKSNIIQDVNPELFTAIINHLRLKALLPASEVPPITMYAEQKTALDNLLSFYMLEDVKVEYIKVSCQRIK